MLLGGAEDRGQMTEGRGRMAENRQQRADDSGQKAEVRRQIRWQGYIETQKQKNSLCPL